MWGKGPISPTKVSSLLLLRLRQLLGQDLLHALLLLDEEGAHDALAHAAPWNPEATGAWPEGWVGYSKMASFYPFFIEKNDDQPLGGPALAVTTIIVSGPCSFSLDIRRYSR